MSENINKAEERLLKLKQKRDALNARIQQAEARQSTIERKNETRRKILIGSYFLDQYRKNNNMSELIKKLDEYLERNSDRKLFNLDNIE